MLRLIGLMISIGFADSLNPSTIAPAMYLATDQRNARGQVTQFTLAVFAVYLAGGLAVALGPGELLLHLVPHPRPGLKYLFEIIGGVVLLTLSAVLWTFRRLLVGRELPEVHTDGRSSALLGATITAVELPTAFPYFAAIAAVVGSGYGVWHQVFLILIFNVAFVLPLLAIIAVLALAGSNAQGMLVSARKWLEQHWPVTLAVVGLIAGLFCVFIGITGLIGLHRSHAGSVARRLRGIVAH
jgi:cytochrome c biogenesis protein CcdA